MTIAIRAIYEEGRLRLLDPIDLNEGQEVKITIQPAALSKEEAERRLRESGILVKIELPEDAEALSTEEREKLGRLFIGDRPSDELISEDRDAR